MHLFKPLLIAVFVGTFSKLWRISLIASSTFKAISWSLFYQIEVMCDRPINLRQ